MKKFLSFRLFFVIIGALTTIIGLNLSKTALAQTIEGSGLETQISRLTETLEKIFVKEKNGKEADLTKPPAYITRANDTIGTPFPDCLGDLYNYSPKRSHLYKSGSSWDMLFISNSGFSDEMMRRELFSDLNGDGLVDYLYSYTESGKAICVYLNNGHGFSPAYRCLSSESYDGPTETLTYYYMGDCADPAGYFDE